MIDGWGILKAEDRRKEKQKNKKRSGMNKFRRGFTLIEILVVIAIIGILISMGLAAFTTAQTKSRDAKRRGDIKTMQNAFEQYYADNSSSYAACATMDTTTYLPAGRPTDPKTGVDYACSGTASTYCACAELESGGGNFGAADCTTAGTDFYCLSNLQ